MKAVRSLEYGGQFTTSSSFEMVEYRACTSVSILTVQARTRHGFDGGRIVSGERDDHPSDDYFGW
jgi:hypothetical protein